MGSLLAAVLAVVVIAAVGVGIAKPPAARAAVCGPPQVIDPNVPNGNSSFFLADGKAYFEGSGALTAVNLATSARTTLTGTPGSLAAVDDAGHRLFMVASGSPTGGTGNVNVIDTTTDTVIASTPIVMSGPSRWAASTANLGAYDAQRGVLFFLMRQRSSVSPFGTIDSRLVRYVVSTGAFVHLATYSPFVRLPVSIRVDSVTGTVYAIENPFGSTLALRARDPLTGAQTHAEIPLSLDVTGFNAQSILAIDSGIATLLVNVPGQGDGLATVDLSSGSVTAPTWAERYIADVDDTLARAFGFNSANTQIREIQTLTGGLTSVVGTPVSPSASPTGFGDLEWDDPSSRLITTWNSQSQVNSSTLMSYPDPASCAFETTPPTVAHVAPANGSSFAIGASATLDLDCHDASSLVYCGAFVVNTDGSSGEYVLDGTSLPTSNLGTFRIRDITAIDTFGNRTERSQLVDATFDVTYSVTTAPADTTAPMITLTTPSSGADYTLGQVVTASYACQDEAGGSGLASCVGTVSNGAAIDTASAGSKTFTVNAADVAGNPSSTSHTYDVLAGDASGTYSGGQTVTTDPGGLGASPAVPIQTSLALPGSLGQTAVSINPEPASGGASGYEFFGTEVVVNAGGAVVPAATPFVVTFTVDKTKLDGPPAVAPTDVQIFRDGVLVGGCTDFSAAIPDPCVASKSIGPGGDGIYVVRTTHFSKFSFARFDWDFSGFFSPVDSLPVVNTVNAGAAVPVKFSLGANRGLNVFADGYPKSQPYSCATGDPSDAIEETVTANSSGLQYDPGANRYSYVWKTTKTWTGCRELTLRFRDGIEVKAHFKFK